MQVWRGSRGIGISKISWAVYVWVWLGRVHAMSVACTLAGITAYHPNMRELSRSRRTYLTDKSENFRRSGLCWLRAGVSAAP